MNQQDEPSPFDIFPHAAHSINVSTAEQTPQEAPEEELRESDKVREIARQKHMSGDIVEAVTLLTQAIKDDPRNTRIAMDMVQIFLDIDELEQATSLFNNLPDKDKTSPMGAQLLGQISFRDLASKTEGKEVLSDRLKQHAEDYDAHFDLAVCLVAEYDYRQAIDHLFTIFDSNPDYKNGASKEMIIIIANMLAANEPNLTQEIRQRLNSSISA